LILYSERQCTAATHGDGSRQGVDRVIDPDVISNRASCDASKHVPGREGSATGHVCDAVPGKVGNVPGIMKIIPGPARCRCPFQCFPVGLADPDGHPEKPHEFSPMIVIVAEHRQQGRAFNNFIIPFIIAYDKGYAKLVEPGRKAMKEKPEKKADPALGTG
jgi:hypothetical protein